MPGKLEPPRFTYSTMTGYDLHRDSAPVHAVLPELRTHPGHLLRRAHQIAVSLFHAEIRGDLTPLQFALLRTLAEHPGIDQVTLAGLVAIDTSTGATVCARLEQKGLLERHVLPANRRQRALVVTPDGQALLARLLPAVQRLRERMLAPLGPGEQQEFMRLLNKLVVENNDRSRAPMALPPADGLSPPAPA